MMLCYSEKCVPRHHTLNGGVYRECLVPSPRISSFKVKTVLKLLAMAVVRLVTVRGGEVQLNGLSFATVEPVFE